VADRFVRCSLCLEHCCSHHPRFFRPDGVLQEHWLDPPDLFDHADRRCDLWSSLGGTRLARVCITSFAGAIWSAVGFSHPRYAVGIVAPAWLCRWMDGGILFSIIAVVHWLLDFYDLDLQQHTGKHPVDGSAALIQQCGDLDRCEGSSRGYVPCDAFVRFQRLDPRHHESGTCGCGFADLEGKFVFRKEFVVSYNQEDNLMEMSQTNSDDMVKPKRSALHKRALTLARMVQVIVIFLTIGLFIASISVHYKSRSIVCRNDPCPPGQLTYRAEQALSQFGMTVDSLVITTITLDILVALMFSISAIIISVRKPRDLFAIFTSMMLVTFGVATFSGGIRGFGAVYPSLHELIETIIFFGSFSFVTFLFTFPNGKFRPRWAWLILAAWTVFQIPRYYLPDSPLNITVSNRLLFNVLFSAGVLGAILTQVYRYRQVSNGVEKQQTKWVIYGMTVGIVGYLTVRILSLFIPDPFGNGILINILSNIAATIFILLVPLSITIAITRYRLWNIDPIINRTLVYGMLSFLTIAFYILVVGELAIYFRSNENNLIISFIATGVVAILFEPLRQRLQRGVNRLMYGERDDPATVLTRLSQRLESALAPESILQTIVETLAPTLRLPYAAISLLDEEPRFTSTSNLPPSELIHLPLTNQTERVGELILAPRSQDESFSPADMKLINRPLA
jgi:hypothetical protein